MMKPQNTELPHVTQTGPSLKEMATWEPGSLWQGSHIFLVPSLKSQETDSHTQYRSSES